MTRKILFVFLIPLGLGVQSCRLIGINYNHVPPKKPGKYKTFTAADSLRGYYGPLRQNNDVTFYDLYVYPNPDTKTLSGKVSIYFTALTEMEQMQLDLHQEMEIQNISMKGKSLPYHRKLTSFFIHFDVPVKKGEKNVIEITFSGTPQKARRPPWEGGLVWKKDKEKNPWIGVACENDGASIWWPLKDHIRDEPDSVSVSIATASNLVGVSNGRLRSMTSTDTGKIYHWHTTYPINPYNITFYVGNFQHFQLPCDGCTLDGVEAYVLPEHLEKAKAQFIQAPRIIAFYEKTFGPYPWLRDGYKLVESPFEGMEHQSAIAYGNGYTNMYMGTDYIVLHETAHEWWGNSVSVGDFADVWLHEGMATYCEVLFIEKVYGINEMQSYLIWQAATVKNKLPVVGPRSVSYWDYKDGDRYNKGSVMLQSLRGTIHNDTLFKNILKSFYLEHAKSTVNTQMFIDHVNQRTGKDYTWFFKQYLFKAQIPVLEAYHRYNREDQTYSFFYRWAETDADFVMPIDIEVDGVSKLLYPTTGFQEYRYKADQKVLSPYYNFYYYYKKVKGPK